MSCYTVLNPFQLTITNVKLCVLIYSTFSTDELN